MLKKRSDTDIVTSLLIQRGNKLVNHLQKKELVTQKHVRENCKSFNRCWEGTTCSCGGGRLRCASHGKLYLLLPYLSICFGSYAPA